jgi:hypothetical protein
VSHISTFQAVGNISYLDLIFHRKNKTKNERKSKRGFENSKKKKEGKKERQKERKNAQKRLKDRKVYKNHRCKTFLYDKSQKGNFQLSCREVSEKHKKPKYNFKRINFLLKTKSP